MGMPESFVEISRVFRLLSLPPSLPLCIRLSQPSLQVLLFNKVSHRDHISRKSKDLYFSKTSNHHPVLQMMWGCSALSSNKSSNFPETAALQHSPVASDLPSQQCLMASQVPSGSQHSPNDPGTQKKKRNVLSKEQRLVLEKHFDNSKYVSQEQCKMLAQRLGMKEKQIKVGPFLCFPLFYSAPPPWVTCTLSDCGISVPIYSFGFLAPIPGWRRVVKVYPRLDLCLP